MTRHEETDGAEYSHEEERATKHDARFAVAAKYFVFGDVDEIGEQSQEGKDGNVD